MISLNSQPITFKEVFTNKSYKIHVNPYWNIQQFLDIVKPILSRLLKIKQNKIEIVEFREIGPTINGSIDITIINKWGDDLTNLSLYIRRKNHLYPEFLKINAMISECPICFEDKLIIRQYTCEHSICLDCYRGCIEHQMNLCCLCRSL